MSDPVASPLRVFFVCTGNQARSPVAAAWAARALAPLTVQVGSAGTLPGPPRPALPTAVAFAAEAGIDLSDHVSSHVSSYDLRPADLVIGFELHHVAVAVVDACAPAGRAFVLTELIRLVSQLAPPAASTDDSLVRARETIRRADDLRRRTGGFVPGEGIRDPAGRKPSEVRAILNEVVTGCDRAIRLLLAR